MMNQLMALLAGQTGKGLLGTTPTSAEGGGGTTSANGLLGSMMTPAQQPQSQGLLGVMPAGTGQKAPPPANAQGDVAPSLTPAAGGNPSADPMQIMQRIQQLMAKGRSGEAPAPSPTAGMTSAAPAMPPPTGGATGMPPQLSAAPMGQGGQPQFMQNPMMQKLQQFIAQRRGGAA